MLVINFFADQVHFIFNLLGYENPLMFVFAFAILFVVEIVVAVSILVKVFDLVRWIGTFFLFRLIFGEWRQWDNQLRKQQTRLTVTSGLISSARAYKYASDKEGETRDEVAKDIQTYRDTEVSTLSLKKLAWRTRWKLFKYRLEWLISKRLGFPVMPEIGHYINMGDTQINAHLGIDRKV